MSDRISLPKDRIKVLLLEGVSDSAVNLFGAADYASITRMPKALDGEALKQALVGVHILGIRSRTALNAEALENADRLMAVGCFCIGTNQVDLEAARRRGIPVFNAPFSNTRSVAELTMAEAVMLLRSLPDKSRSAHEGGWDKSAANSFEVRGRTLGIVGYGNIGSQLSVLAEAFGMRVIYYDHTVKLPHGNARPCATLAELLGEADVVTLHVPETASTKGMIGAAQIAQMKPGAILINNARGTILDQAALAAAITEGRLLGAAVDVFPEEPARNGDAFISPLQGVRNVILTPHIGFVTEESYRRQHGGSAVPHRRGSRPKAGGLQRHRRHVGRGELPAGAAAHPGLRRALHARARQHAGPAGQGERGLRPPRHQHRRAVPADRQRHRLRGGRQRRHPRRRGHPGRAARPARHHPRPLAVRAGIAGLS